MFQEVNASLHRLHLEDERPWLVGFSGDKDSNMLALLILDVALSIPPNSEKGPSPSFARTRTLRLPPLWKWSKAHWIEC
jgi:hypothetical protein